MKKIMVERNGKKPEQYTIYQDYGAGLYITTRDLDGLPKPLYLVNLGMGKIKEPPFIYTQDGHKLGGKEDGS
ncbi:MAG: hypothetical protein P9M07_02620 [Candidatus Aceula meridiana]|nr:hypothetical protein [Candidatus Aceula meridiana]